MQLQGDPGGSSRARRGSAPLNAQEVQARLLASSGQDQVRSAHLASSAQDQVRAPLAGSGQDQGHGKSASSDGGAPLSSSLVGKRVGPYRINALIAQGGMGAVYEAVHERLQRAVALKTLLAGPGASNEDVQRFLNEARAAARLSHPNLVQIHDVGEQGGVRYLAMELVRGDTLHGLIRRGGPLEEAAALRIVADAARGLAHAHGQGVLHRDLKPANVLLGADGVPRLTDFGVAKAKGNASLTATGTALGTPSYMSPEQAMGHNDALDARTDVWGLGAILYECLTGRPPFDLGTHLQTMQAVVSDPAVPPSELRPGLTAEVEAICLKCLSKKREERYASCEALIEDCQRFLAGRTVQAKAPTRLSLLVRRARRHAPLLAGVAGGVAALLLVALVSARPALEARRTRAAAAAATERLRADLKGAREGMDAGGPALEAAARLDLAALRAAAVAAAAPEPGAARVAAEAALDAVAGEAGLEASAISAEAHLRLAGDPAPLTSGAAAHLLEASLAAPEAPPGRLARLRLAAALRAREAGRALGRDQLVALARGEDDVARRACAELAVALASDGRWGEALDALARAEGATGLSAPDAARLQAVGPLARAIGHLARLPAAERWAVTRSGAVERSLVLAGGGRVWRQRVEAPSEEGGAVRSTDGLWRPAPSPLAALLPADWDGDGKDELIVIEGRGRVGVGRLDGDPSSWVDWVVRAATRYAPHDAATGDVDGDGKDDVAVLFLQDRGGSFVLLGGRRTTEALRLPNGPPAYCAGRITCADLDGDGRDEVILGGTGFDPTLEVAAYDPARRALVTQLRLPLGPVSAISVHRLVEGERREGLVVAVDGGRDDPRQAALAEAPGRGADGLYLIETPVGASGPEVVARWPFVGGLDDDPTSGPARARAGQVAGVVFREAAPSRRAWVARSARVDGVPRLELAPRDALGRDGTPPVALGVALPADALGVARAADLDGNGEEELLLGGVVLGLAVPRRAGLDLAQASPRAAVGAGPGDLLDATRAAFALGDEALGVALVARLRAAAPGSVEATTAALAHTDALLAAADVASRAADAAFGRLDLEAGRRESALARELAERSGQTALEAARAEPRARGEALARAAWAFRLADQPDQAAAALEAALASRSLGLDMTARLTEELLALRRAAALDGLTIDLTRPEGRAALTTRHPLRAGVERDGKGITLLCAPEVEDWAVVPVTIDRPVPLALEAVVRTTGPGWASRAEVGLFDAEPGGPGPLTGVRVSLWDVHSGKLGVQAVVAGQPTGTLVRLPSAAGVLRVRLELSPGPSGGLRVRVRLRDALEGLLLDQSTEVDAPPPTHAAYVGLRSLRHDGTPEEACTEQASWPMAARVVLERIRLEAGRPAIAQADEDTLDLSAAHGALSIGEPGQARARYDQALAVTEAVGGVALDAQLYRAFARARLGEQGGEEDIVAAVRGAPYDALLLLEETLGEEVLDALAPSDLAVLAAALRALARDPDPLVAAIGRSLQGFSDPPLPLASFEDDSDRELAALYVTMRAVDNAARWSVLPRYKALAPESRLPRAFLPPSLLLPETTEEQRAAEAAARDPTVSPMARYRALLGLRAAHPGAPEHVLAVASHLNTGFRLYAQAASLVSRGLERGLFRNERAGQANLAVGAYLSNANRLDEAMTALEAARATGGDRSQIDALERLIRERRGELPGGN